MATLMQIDKDGRLSPMQAEPYGTEAELQALLARHPDLLSADDDGARRWLLIRREMSVPIQGSDIAGGDATGYIDHLFVDQDGVPTIVEVKRATNTEARRQVAGQILDYAANAPLHWSGGLLRQAFEAPLEAESQDPGNALSAFLDAEDADPEAFWEQVETNLREGRVRLVFVMDIVPLSLQRIVEFLNRQMASVEVMAVEIRRHSGSSGDILEVRRKGETASRRRNAGLTRRERPTKEVWLGRFLGHHGSGVADGIDAIIAFMNKHGDVFATAAQSPSLGLKLRNVSRGSYPIFVKWNGSITVSFSYLMRNDAMTDASVRAEWATRLMSCAAGRSRFGAPNGDVIFAPDVLEDAATVLSILGVVEELIAVLEP
jgi:hypothetical protein